MKYINFVCVLFLFSCNNNPENKNTQNALEYSTQEEKKYITELSDSEIREIAVKEITFKCPDAETKDFVVYKTDVNSYKVRFLHKLDKLFDQIHWNTVIMHIELNVDNKYSFYYERGGNCNYYEYN